MAISTRKIVPKQPNEYPKQPYLGSEPAGSGSEIRAAIKPISGVKSTDIINAQPKPRFLRLPKSPTNTSSSIPDARAKITIEDTILFSFPFSVFRFPFHSVECSKRQLFPCSVGEE